MVKINAGTIMNLTIAIQGRIEQDQILDYLQQSERKTSMEEEQLDKLRLLKQGPINDLLVVSRPQHAGSRKASLVLMSALLDSGLPVLLLPPRKIAAPGRHIAIAWNRGMQEALDRGRKTPRHGAARQRPGFAQEIALRRHYFDSPA